MTTLSASLDQIQHTFFIAGPTAVGKTGVATAVAEACNGEIVGVDAFQVYEGLDILTAKPSQQELARVPHHLVGVVPLAESFNVARYVELASAAITGILSRGRLPIVAGGTGLYIRALTRGLAEIPQADIDLRADLAATPLPRLLERLETLDPVAAGAIDRQNPRRVLRALEVCLITGKPFSSFRQEWDKAQPFHGVALECGRDELYTRINRRTVAMFEQGVTEEVANVIHGDAPLSETARQVLGLREIEALIGGAMSKAECVAAIQQATRQYAKRQLTWFRREPNLLPVSLTAASDISSIIQRAAAVPR